MLGEELQQLEFLERQVQGAGAQPGRVGGLVDSQVTGADLVGGGRGQAGPAADGQPQPGFHLSRAGRVQNHIVGAPVSGHRGQPALGHDGQQRGVQARRAQQQAQAPGLGQVTPGVHQDGVRGRGVRQDRHLRRPDPHAVQQQAQGRKDFRCWFQGTGEKQQVTHALPPPPCGPLWEAVGLLREKLPINARKDPSAALPGSDVSEQSRHEHSDVALLGLRRSRPQASPRRRSVPGPSPLAGGGSAARERNAAAGADRDLRTVLARS